IGKLDDVGLEIAKAVDLLDAWPGALVARELHLWVSAALVDAVHRLVHAAECRAFNVAFDGAGAHAQTGANAERIDGRTSIEQFADRELVQVARSGDLHFFQASAVERRPNVARIAGQVAAIEPDCSQDVPKPIPCGVGNFTR